MKKRDFMRLEFIGLDVTVRDSTCPEYRSISGTVVDETKNTLVIASQEKERTIPKQCCEFQFTYEGTRFDVQGKDIRHRPEDRIKRIR
jgi:ribonuclease P protein subunit POP4